MKPNIDPSLEDAVSSTPHTPHPTPNTVMASKEQIPSFCLSHLEDDLHSSLDSLFIENAGTNDLFQQLDVYCETTTTTANLNESKPIIIVGEAGCGKSIALANWTARRKANAVPSRRLDYSELTFWHTIGCSRLSTSVTHLLRRLVNELIAHFNLKDDMDLADEKLSWVLPRLLERASKRGRVVIVIDGGLQHICSQDKDLGLRWLPLSLPQNVRMVLSATKPSDGLIINTQGLTDYAKRRLVKVQQTWDEIQRRKWPTLQLQPLQTSHVGNFIEDFLSSSEYQHIELAASERKQIIEMISTHSCATNPLFITLMLRGLCHALSFGYNINQCLVLMLPCRNAEELTDKMRMLFESGMPRESSLSTVNPNRLGLLLGDSLCLLFVARHGLHEDELFDLLSHIRRQSLWNKETEDTVLPVKLKIVSMLMEKKTRLIDIFR